MNTTQIKTVWEGWVSGLAVVSCRTLGELTAIAGPGTYLVARDVASGRDRVVGVCPDPSWSQPVAYAVDA